MMKPLNENSCRILVEYQNPVFFALDLQGKITRISHGCKDILGFLPEEMTGRLLSAFVISEQKNLVGEMCEQEKQGIHDSLCFLVVGKEGGFHPAMVISRSVFDGQEKTGMMGIIGEAGTGKPAEKMVQQANTTIHLLNSIVRHDINNQLTVLSGYLSLLEQDDGTVRSKDIVGILLDAAKNIHSMITFTSEYKDIGKHLPKWTNLYEAFQSVRSSVDAEGIQIEAESACQEIELFCDPMLMKVFHLLIENSLSQENAVSEITLRWRTENGRAIIVYGDNGTGIPETVKSTLFLPGKMKKNAYGLFLVHEILALFDFTITETGTPGMGVRFEIGVPSGSFRIVKKKLL
jgi:PAS domain S-box-containing protein